MARNIKELAELCNVSEQALRKWCARNQVAKDVSQHYIIDETIEKAILKHYGVDVEKQVSQPEKPSFATDETTKELISMLKNELEAKNKQIEEITKSLQFEQGKNKELQEKVLFLEQKPDVVDEEESPDSELSDKSDKEIYEIALSKLPPVPNFFERLFSFDVDDWRIKQARAISQLSEKEREILYKYGFVGDGK